MTQAHTTGQERALKEALKPFATAWTVWSDLKVLKPESEHVQRGPQGAVLASDFKRAHEVLSALPHQPATDEGEAAEWAREWHRCVETILTMAGLSPALGASEAALAMQEYITRVEATPTSHPPAAETRLRAAVIEECAKVADVKGEESADGSMTQWAFFDAAHAIRALALTQPEPTAPQGGEEERAAELIRSYFDARQAGNDCPECGNEGPWEHCGPCSDRIGPVIARMSNFAINMDMHGEIAEGADKRDAVARIISLAKGAPENGQMSIGAWWWDKRHDRARPEHFEGECRDEDRKHADLMIPLLRAALSAQQGGEE